MAKLNKYTILVPMFVYGEDESDALDYATTAVNYSNLLDQDGVFGIGEISEEDIDDFEE